MSESRDGWLLVGFVVAFVLWIFMVWKVVLPL